MKCEVAEWQWKDRTWDYVDLDWRPGSIPCDLGVSLTNHFLSHSAFPICKMARSGEDHVISLSMVQKKNTVSDIEDIILFFFFSY